MSDFYLFAEGVVSRQFMVENFVAESGGFAGGAGQMIISLSLNL